MEINAGDTIVTKFQEYIVVSAEGFNLLDDLGDDVLYILISKKYGIMEGYFSSIEEIKQHYHIVNVIPFEAKESELPEFAYEIKIWQPIKPSSSFGSNRKTIVESNIPLSKEEVYVKALEEFGLKCRNYQFTVHKLRGVVINEN